MNTITVTALETKNLDTTCFRGSATMADLARISAADVFDQITNPDGLQRDLSKKHAAEAYTYFSKAAEKDRPRAIPEIILNVRDRKVVEREVLTEGDGFKIVSLTFDLEKILNARTVKVSRVDGNHRLYFAAGDAKDRAPIELAAPFQIHVGLDRDQETYIFSTVNAEQKGLNTSHLATLRSRITPEEIELELHPQRAFARRLASDAASPWCDRVHMGGSKLGTKEAGQTTPITFIALEHGVQRTLKKSGYLPERESDTQYGLIRHFWQAVKVVYPEAFDTPKEYLVAKNIGVQAFSLLAAEVIDKCLVVGNVEVGHMVPFLEAAKDTVDWHKDSTDTAGMSGNRAVLILAGRMSKALPADAAGYKDPDEAEAEQRAALAVPELEESAA